MTNSQPSPDSPDNAVSVVDAPERHRFEVSVDGATVGFCDYADEAGVRAFPHTEVDEAYGGRGLATVLIRTALDASRVAGLTVRPQCAAVRHFIDKHPEYADLVAAGSDDIAVSPYERGR